MSEAFYKLTPEMARTLRENLTLSEWRLWSYLITLDPFGDRYHQLPPMVEVLAEVGISKASFYRAIAKLQELELFDFQSEIKFRRLTGEKKVSPGRKKSHPGEKSLTHEKKVSPVRQNSHPRDSQSVEALQEKGSTPSQTLKTSSDLKDSLSLDDKLKKQLPEGERENFLIFAKQQASLLPTKPVLVDKWIAANLPSLLSKYREEVWEMKKAQVYEESPQCVQNSNPSWDSLPSSVATDENVAGRAADSAEPLHRAIAEGLANGSIRKLDPQFDALWDANGRWWRCNEWIAEAQYQEERASEAYQAEKEKAKAAIAAMKEQWKMNGGKAKGCVSESTPESTSREWLVSILREPSFWGDRDVLTQINTFWKNSELRQHIQAAIDFGWCQLVWQGDRIAAIKEPAF
jgi:hypothetical protein